MDAFMIMNHHENCEIAQPLVPLYNFHHAFSYVVKNHFWELATEIVGESHKQSVDLSFAVRKAVKDVRNKADELIRYLNPKYHEKQKVIPVFRWAQNDTHIFLTIKYSVKWDAPGAVNVKDPQVPIAIGFAVHQL